MVYNPESRGGDGTLEGLSLPFTLGESSWGLGFPVCTVNLLDSFSGIRASAQLQLSGYK